MRMIIRQYVASLKEENELDALISNTLYANKVLPQTKTTKGARQRGVDIEAIGSDENDDKRLYIITVKQGDLDRRMWDKDQNAVRQSLDQIIETHLRLLTTKLKELPCTIIVATNGEMKQTVDEDWKGYVEKNSSNKLDFQFWGLNKIADMVDSTLITDTMLSKPELTLFRKTLALIEDNEYDLHHYYQLISGLFDSTTKYTHKNIIKLIRLCLLLQNIIFKWCQNIGNIKNAYIASERMILIAGKFLIDKKFHVKKKIWREFLTLLLSRQNIGFEYVKKVTPQFSVPYRLGHYTNAIEYEYPIVCFEQLGIFAQIGLEHIFLFEGIDNDDYLRNAYSQRIKYINRSITNLITNNPGAYFPQFDEHIIDISLVLQFYYQTHDFYAGKWYLNLLTKRVINSYKYLNRFHPIFRTDFDELNLIWAKGKEPRTKSSHLILSLAEWNLVYGELEGYKFLSRCKMPDGIYRNINLQLWIPDKKTENYYYTHYGMNNSGTTIVNYEIPEDYMDLIKRIQEEHELFDDYDDFKVLSNLMFFPNLASRHYRKIQFPILWRIHLLKRASA